MNKQLWLIQLLGGLEARQGEHTVSRFRTRKTGALLAYLALYGERAHSRETLLDLLWPDSDLVAARNSLSVSLTSLRRQFEPAEATNSAPALGTVVVADRATIRLRPGTFTTDVAAFETALREADEMSEDADRRLALLADAVSLYAGELLPGYYDDWAVAERERLADAYLQALRTLTSLYMGVRDFERALDCAHRAVQADPLSEESRRLLIRLYAIVGRPAMGLEQFRDLERRRSDEGEDPPSEDTRRLTLRLAEGTDKETGGGPNRARRSRRAPGQDDSMPHPDSSAPAAPAVAAVAAAPPVNLPLRFDRFFGRSEELARLAALFSAGDTRLITLTGPGGAGKTRLAVEAGARAHDLLGADKGVFFVPLADVPEAAWIPDAIRNALDLPLAPSAVPLDQIVSALAGRQCLIVLDNLEHLLAGGPLDGAGAAAIVRALMTRVPGLLILVTSRQRLGLDGEREFPVAPLPVPGEHVISPGEALEYPGVQMFVDRARARRVDFQITTGNVAAVSALCARLEGIPLALELAAAWSKLLTPAQMAERLTDRFELLVSRRRDVPERHRTLRAAIEWGYELLSPDARRLYPLLSAFRGDWSVADAQAVCEAADASFQGRTLAALTELRDASFIVAAERDDAPEMRLRILETLREFADELLAPEERAALEQSHAAYFLARAEEAAARLRGPEQKVFFDRLESDHDNLRAVLDRTAGGETGLLLAGALAYFWKMHGHYQEGSAWLARVLSVVPPERTVSSARARALKGAGNLAYDRADYAAATDCYARSLEMYRALNEPEGMASVLINLGNVAYRGGDGDRARRHYSEALTYYRSRNDRWGIASALGSLGNVAQAESDFASARGFQEESLAISREIGDERMTAYTLHNLGNLAVEQKDSPRARVLFEDSLVRKRALGDRRGVAALLASIGYLEMQDGAGDRARESLKEALRLAWELGDRLGTVTALDGLAWHAAASGADTKRAARLWSATEAEREARSLPPSELHKAQFTALAAGARAATASPADFDAAWAEGRALTLESAVAYALSEI